MSPARVRWALLAAALAGFGANAESLYVIDRLFVGVHEEPTAASAILQMLPTGAELEVIERDGELVRVRTADGIEGWVEQAYLTADKPARATVVELRGQLETDTQELERARQLIDDLERELRESEARTGALETELGAAHQEREEAEATAAEAREELARARSEPAPDTPIPSETLRQLQQLAEDNQRLRQEAAELEALQAMAAEQQAAHESAPGAGAEPPVPAPGAAPSREAPPADGRRSARLPVPHLQDWQWLLFGSALLLAFGAGGYLVDLGMRRRHGGFRV